MRTPAYAREVIARRDAGKAVNIFIYVGDDAWRLAQSRPPGGRLAVPAGAAWREMDFACVSGLELLVVARGWDQQGLDDFSRHLIWADARLVVGLLVQSRYVLDAAPPRVMPTYYRPELCPRVAA